MTAPDALRTLLDAVRPIMRAIETNETQPGVIAGELSGELRLCALAQMTLWEAVRAAENVT